MRAQGLLLVLLLFSTALAGCSGKDADPQGDLGGGTEDTDTETTDSSEIETPPEPWDGDTERILMDQTIDLAEASAPDPFGMGLCAGSEASGANDPKVHSCPYQWFFFEDPATLVPQGTGLLRMEATLTSPVASTWRVMPECTANVCEFGDNYLATDFTTEASMTWDIPLTPDDWDLANATESSTFFVYERDNTEPSDAGGSLAVKVTAVRDLAWTM